MAKKKTPKETYEETVRRVYTDRNAPIMRTSYPGTTPESREFTRDYMGNLYGDPTIGIGGGQPGHAILDPASHAGLKQIERGEVPLGQGNFMPLSPSASRQFHDPEFQRRAREARLARLRQQQSVGQPPPPAAPAVPMPDAKKPAAPQKGQYAESGEAPPPPPVQSGPTVDEEVDRIIREREAPVRHEQAKHEDLMSDAPGQVPLTPGEFRLLEGLRDGTIDPRAVYQKLPKLGPAAQREVSRFLSSHEYQQQQEAARRVPQRVQDEAYLELQQSSALRTPQDRVPAPPPTKKERNGLTTGQWLRKRENARLAVESRLKKMNFDDWESHLKKVNRNPNMKRDGISFALGDFDIRKTRLGASGRPSVRTDSRKPVTKVGSLGEINPRELSEGQLVSDRSNNMYRIHNDQRGDSIAVPSYRFPDGSVVIDPDGVSKEQWDEFYSEDDARIVKARLRKATDFPDYMREQNNISSERNALLGDEFDDDLQEKQLEALRKQENQLHRRYLSEVGSEDVTQDSAENLSESIRQRGVQETTERAAAIRAASKAKRPSVGNVKKTGERLWSDFVSRANDTDRWTSEKAFWSPGLAATVEEDMRQLFGPTFDLDAVLSRYPKPENTPWEKVRSDKVVKWLGQLSVEDLERMGVDPRYIRQISFKNLSEQDEEYVPDEESDPAFDDKYFQEMQGIHEGYPKDFNWDKFWGPSGPPQSTALQDLESFEKG